MTCTHDCLPPQLLVCWCLTLGAVMVGRVSLKNVRCLPSWVPRAADYLCLSLRTGVPGASGIPCASRRLADLWWLLRKALQDVSNELLQVCPRIEVRGLAGREVL